MAWSAGDYESALLRLDEADACEPAGEPRDEILILRARALYQMLRYGDMIDVLSPATTTLATFEANVTVRMLLGMALARSGNVSEGLRTLVDATRDAAGAGVSRAIQAELAHARGLTYWMCGDHEQALRFALAAEQADADVTSVRATQLRGFVAVSQRKFPEALRIFRTALDRYGRCRERYDALVEQTAFQVSSLELTLRSASEPGSHRSIGARGIPSPGPVPSSSTSPSYAQRMALDGWLHALDGDSVNALKLMRQAEHAAPTVAWRIWALAQRANVTLGFGEPRSAYDVAAQAQAFVRDVDWEATQGEERLALLTLAEVLASLAPADAPALLNRYDTLPPISRNYVLADDPRLQALELHVRGVVTRAAGDEVKARTLLADAACAWRAIGNLWRTALALIELDATVTVTGMPGSPRQRYAPIGFPLDTGAAIVREHFPRSFLARRIQGWLTAYDDAVAGTLAPHKRRVLGLVLAGLDNKQIAARLDLRYNSIRSYLADIHAEFGTHSDRELFAECLRQGITGPPTVNRAPGMRKPSGTAHLQT